jgi:hypothetical protein
VISPAANLAGEVDVAAACRAQLLDEGRYLASVRTMYRLLQSCSAVRERRNQLRHPEYAKPELLAVTPNQVLSWDITKLKGPVRGSAPMVRYDAWVAGPDSQQVTSRAPPLRVTAPSYDEGPDRTKLNS